MTDENSPTTTHYRITRVTVRDYKSLEFLDLTPDPAKVLILIHGANNTGKTSVLDALIAALAGKRAQPTDPIRAGQDKSTLRVTLQGTNGDTIHVKRIITAKGDALELTSPANGGYRKLSKPQTTLDSLANALMFRPLKFADARPAEQIDMLYDAIGKREELDHAREQRRQAHRAVYDHKADIAQLEKAAKNTPTPPAGDAAAAAALIRRANEIGPKREAIKGRNDRLRHERDMNSNAITANREAIDQARQSIKALEAKIASLEAANTDLARKNTAAEHEETQNRQQLAALPDDVTQQQLEHAMHVRDAHASYQAIAKQAAAAATQLTEAHRKLAELEAKHDAARKAVRTMIDETTGIPAGVDLEDNAVTYKGRPLSNLSGSERVMLSASITAAMAPALRDMLLDEIGQLDDATLSHLIDFARGTGYRLWATDIDPRHLIDAQRVAMPQDNNTPHPDDTPESKSAPQDDADIWEL